MIQVLLCLGLLYVLLNILVVHIGMTSDIPIIRQTTGIPADKSLNPWFSLLETILIVAILYVVKDI